MIQDGYLFTHDLERADRIPSPNLVQRAITRAEAADHWKYRILDYLFLLLAAPFVLPTLAVIAIWVKLDDPSSPVFFSQTRYGKNGTPFQILKVRTMVRGADQIKQTLLMQSEDKGPGFKLDNDPRITRPGRILRKLYLDELAQFWNVARGDMAIVGPRANSSNPAELEAWQRLRLLVRPGITGSWQVMRNKPRDFNERSLIDLDYIGRKSLAYDFAILLRTVLVVFVRPTGC
jgi:lipopolysaccharide/colanic/teichoic acid biosynthesis glycosyltransferase